MLPRTAASALPLRAYFGVMTAAYALAAALGLALTWDGAYYFFHAINDGQAMVPFHRVVDLPLEQPLIIARSVTDNPSILAAILGFSFFLVPLASLGASWLVVRKYQPRLFIWSVLGIGLFLLPGQAAVVSEAIIAVQLAWPIVLAVLTGRPSEHWDIVLLFSIALALAHPLAVPLFVGIALAVGLFHLARRSQGRRELWWIAVFLAFAGFAWVRTAGAELAAAHAQELSAASLRIGFDHSVAGLPLVMFGLACAGAMLLVAGTALHRLGAKAWARAAEVLAFALLTSAGLVLLPWAADVHSWWRALDFRFFAFIYAVPLMGMAFVDAVLMSPSADDKTDAGTNVRQWLAVSQAFVVFAVLAAFSVSFHNLQTQLASDVGPNSPSCTTISALQWATHTPMDHWAVTANSLLIQGGTPTHVVLSQCSGDFSAGLPLADWDTISYQGGWYDLSKLKAKLVSGAAAVP